jgi:hypothetical protein
MKTLYNPRTQLKALPQGYGGCANTRSILYVLWTISNKIAIAQFQSDAFGEKKGGLVGWGDAT